MRMTLMAASAAALVLAATAAHAEGPVGADLSPIGGGWVPGNSAAARAQQEIGSQPNCFGDRNSQLATNDGQEFGQFISQYDPTDRASLYFFVGTIIGIAPEGALPDTCGEIPIGG